MILALLLAMVLDAWLGEPKWLWDRMPHPAVLMGRCVEWLDERLNNRTRVAGILAVLALCGGALVLGLALAAVPGVLVDIIVAAVLLAHRSLIDHVKAVATGLRGSLSDGRAAVAMIVGRDVRDLNEPAVARSAIESGAENFSDGFVAPAFWFVVAGLPGLLIYKVVNTADSMIGYRSEKYQAFGWAAARLDDVLNYVPARLTALLIRLFAKVRAPMAAIRRDAALHRSPNAGWPEAAMAPALGISLSGPRSYDGQMQDFPWVNPEGRKDATADDVDASISVLWTAWWVVFWGALGVMVLGGALRWVGLVVFGLF